MPRPRLLSLTIAATTGLWLGGLTFYAAVVVPIGSQVVGRMDQGLITQRVTNWLNLFAVIAILCLGVNACRQRKSLAIATWLLIATLQVFLLLLHPVLDRQLALVSEPNQFSGPTFYQWHRAYLLATTLMWLLAVVHVGLIVGSDRCRSEGNIT